jgi:hypothetical protein
MMGSFSPLHWIIVLGVMFLTGWPLARIAKRTSHSAVWGWIAGTIGLFFLGPLVFVWWIALAKWASSPKTQI